MKKWGETMGLLDRTKNLGKRTVNAGIGLGKKGVALGKKGIDKTKDAIRKKECSECRHYTPKDDAQGDCPIAGARLASADAATCPQNAFEFKAEAPPAGQPQG
jgi:hypothetical protein